MERGDKLDRVERALATNNYEGLSDRELKAGLDDRPVMKMYSRFTGTVLTDAIWSAHGKHRLSGWIDVDRHDGVVRISHRETDEEIYVGDGSSIGFREAGIELPPVRTLFLDEAGLALERRDRGLIDLKESKARYLVGDEVDHSARMPRTVYGEPIAPQAYVTWDFGNPKLDPNQQLSGMKRHIHDRMGAVGFDDHAFVFECGQNFRAAIEALPVIDDLFNSWSACTSYRGDVPPHFILADNVRIEAGHHEPNNAMLFPRSRERLEALGRLQECTIKIVGLNVPTETDTLQGKITKLRADVVALRAEVAFLKAASPPKPPSIGEVLGRALGAGR